MLFLLRWTRCVLRRADLKKPLHDRGLDSFVRAFVAQKNASWSNFNFSDYYSCSLAALRGRTRRHDLFLQL
jgi:hypothetical protein